MQANNNKYSQIRILILAISLSLSLLCITHSQNDDDDDTNIINVCNSDFGDASGRVACNATLRSDENNKTCGPKYDLVCMGRFVNTKAINATQTLKQLAADAATNATAPPPGANGERHQRSVASTCNSSYNSALGNLKICKTNYRDWTKNKTSMEKAWIKSNILTYASAAETNLNTCGDESDSFAAASKTAIDLINVELATIQLFNVTA